MQRYKDPIIEGGEWLWLVFSSTIKKNVFWLFWTEMTVKCIATLPIKDQQRITVTVGLIYAIFFSVL